MTLIKKKYALWASRIFKLFKLQKRNIFKTTYNQKALLSHIIYPFFDSNGSHINYDEVLIIADVLNNLGYVVDICDDNFPCAPTEYDLIVSTGGIFSKHFERIPKACVKILYAPGMHVNFQNPATINRAIDFYQNKGEWLISSCRVVGKTDTEGLYLSDGIVTLGNSICVESYKKNYDGLVFGVPSPYRCNGRYADACNIRSSKSKNIFLWIGGSGKVHKGLDLCLEFFAKNPNLILNIFGDFTHEQKFLDIFAKEFACNNIINHGFARFDSEKFKSVIKEVSAVIYPTASEGGSPSVVSAIGNGALFPIISKGSSLDIPYSVCIHELSQEGLSRAINEYLCLDWNYIVHAQSDNLKFVRKNNSMDSYRNQLTNAIKEIIKVKKDESTSF